MRRPGLRLRARSPRLRAQAGQQVLRQRRHLCRWSARPQALRRLHHPGNRPRIRRNRRLPDDQTILPSSSTGPGTRAFCSHPKAPLRPLPTTPALASALHPTGVVIFNTGAGLKYADMIAEAMSLKRPESESRTPHQHARRRHHYAPIRSDGLPSYRCSVYLDLKCEFYARARRLWPLISGSY